VADGYLREAGRRLAFTVKGKHLAEKLVRRHRLAEHLLIEVIGLAWHKAHHEAERWERVITDEVEARLVEVLGDPATCPHGNPIPGSSRPVDLASLIPLKDVGPNGEVVLRRLTEDLELELEVMRFLEDSGLVPGARLTVRTIGPDGTMNLEVAGRHVALGPHLSDNLWVEPARGSRRRR
jgi:DtxR family Mn-dependent transcriptional regulator